MRAFRWQWALYTFLFLLVFAEPVSGMARKPEEQRFVPGQVLVKFQENVPQDRIVEIVQGEGGTIKSIIGRTGIHLVVLPEGVEVMEAVDRFSVYPEVRYAEPNYRTSPLEEK